MVCCGNLIDITTNDDRTPVYFCQNCGRQGSKATFAEPVEPPPAIRFERIRDGLAGWCDRLSERLRPRY